MVRTTLIKPFSRSLKAFPVSPPNKAEWMVAILSVDISVEGEAGNKWMRPFVVEADVVGLFYTLSPSLGSRDIDRNEGCSQLNVTAAPNS
jgi:hypothetical protein